MTHDPEKHHRRSIRLRDYDYAQAGAYFVTVCTKNKECIFGTIVDHEMRLNEYGRVVEEEWLRTGQIRQNVELDEHVIMPNHFHAILVIMDDRRGTVHRAPTRERFQKPVSGSLPTIVRSFKAAVTQRIGTSIWQRGYYEHVIRGETDLNRIRKYIHNNPANWESDDNNPVSNTQRSISNQIV